MSEESNNSYHFIDSTFNRKDVIDNAARRKFEGNYANEPNHPKLTTIVNGITRRVEGFSFHKDEIISILNHPNKTIIGAYFAFGINDGSVKEPDGTIKGALGITIIGCGIDDKGSLVHEENRMFDYSKPCPGNCPGGRAFELNSPILPLTSLNNPLLVDVENFNDETNVKTGFINVDDLLTQEKIAIDNGTEIGRKSQIKKDIARQFRQNYLNLPSHPNVTRLTNTQIEERVKGFSFPKNELEIALDIQNPNSEIIGIYLTFGHSSGNLNASLDGTTLILYGIKANGELDETEGRIFDYSKPCPENCPGQIGFSLPPTVK